MMNKMMASMKGPASSVLLLLLAVSGCDLSTHCDPGQIYRNYTCYDVSDGGTSDAGTDDGAAEGGSADAGDDSSSGACGPFEGFGATCTAVDQCSCGLDNCVTFMGADYCSHSGCLANPSLCPAGWTCLDVSAFDPTVGSVCTRP